MERTCSSDTFVCVCGKLGMCVDRVMQEKLNCKRPGIHVCDVITCMIKLYEYFCTLSVRPKIENDCLHYH